MLSFKMKTPDFRKQLLETERLAKYTVRSTLLEYVVAVRTAVTTLILQVWHQQAILYTNN